MEMQRESHDKKGNALNWSYFMCVQARCFYEQNTKKQQQQHFIIIFMLLLLNRLREQCGIVVKIECMKNANVYTSLDETNDQ